MSLSTERKRLRITETLQKNKIIVSPIIGVSVGVGLTYNATIINKENMEILSTSEFHINDGFIQIGDVIKFKEEKTNNVLLLTVCARIWNIIDNELKIIVE